MRAGAIVAPLLLFAIACGPEPAPFRGIETRIFVDKTEARVGDAVGVTIEIETPEGFALETPSSPPPDDRFFTEHVETLEPIWIPGGVRHRLLWTLRARSVGEHPIPELAVPLVRPDGQIQPLPVGGIPLPVRSVRGEVPERDIFFDIRPPPAIESGPVWIWVVSGTGVAGLLLAGLLYRRRNPLEESELTRPAALARVTLPDIDAALAETDSRELARRLTIVIRRFAERCWVVSGEAWTPEELPERVDRPVVLGLRELEAVRFAREPVREAVVDTARRVRSYLTDVARHD
jgi:hypothetical protein